MRKLTVITIFLFSAAQLMTIAHKAIQTESIEGVTNRAEVLEREVGQY